MLKNSSKISHYLSNLWMNISGKKWIVYQAKKIGIQSLFISIWFEIDQIVCDRPNIAMNITCTIIINECKWCLYDCNRQP